MRVNASAVDKIEQRRDRASTRSRISFVAEATLNLWRLAGFDVLHKCFIALQI